MKIQKFKIYVFECVEYYGAFGFLNKGLKPNKLKMIFLHTKSVITGTPLKIFKKPKSLLNTMSKELSIDTTFAQNGQSQKYFKILTKLFVTVNTYECAHAHGHYGQANRSQ